MESDRMRIGKTPMIYTLEITGKDPMSIIYISG